MEIFCGSVRCGEEAGRIDGDRPRIIVQKLDDILACTTAAFLGETGGAGLAILDVSARGRIRG